MGVPDEHKQFIKPFQLLKEMAVRKLYGSLEIKMEAGKVVLIRKTENVKNDDK